MRVKTEARRQAIVEAAAEAFREKGFDAASMADVSARLGGSKATLYSYFSSKEDLFAAVMMQAAKAQASNIFQTLHDADALEPALFAFGRDYIAFMLKPEVLAVSRMCVADGERTGVGRIVYEKGVRVAWGLVAERLERAMQEGILRRADSWRAAWHLKGLCETGLVDARLRGCLTDVSAEEVDDAVVAGVEAFLRAYKV
jgi:AcrR family transcriptional regulator